MSKNALFDIKEICFAYGIDPVIQSVSAQLEQGRFYGLVGPNGCGKTTLLDLINGSKIPGSGSIHFQGDALSSIPKKELAKKIALVPQEFDTGFGYTVEEIVLMGRHPHIPRFSSPAQSDWHAVDKAIEQIGIDNLRDRPVNSLSGGQKQRAIVARALAQDSKVLLFDEATANLDIKYSLQIFRLARELVEKEGRTVIAVIHNLNFASAYCDEILFMQDGRLVSRGQTKSVMTAENIEQVFGIQSQVIWNDYSSSYQVNYSYRK
jgi:iron complex transport system ATP-binding protein